MSPLFEEVQNQIELDQAHEESSFKRIVFHTFRMVPIPMDPSIDKPDRASLEYSLVHLKTNCHNVEDPWDLIFEHPSNSSKLIAGICH